MDMILFQWLMLVAIFRELGGRWPICNSNIICYHVIVVMSLKSSCYGHNVFTPVYSCCLTSLSICLFFSTLAVLPGHLLCLTIIVENEQHPGFSRLLVTLVSVPCKYRGNMILLFCSFKILPSLITKK